MGLMKGQFSKNSERFSLRFPPQREIQNRSIISFVEPEMEASEVCRPLPAEEDAAKDELAMNTREMGKSFFDDPCTCRGKCTKERLCPNGEPKGMRDCNLGQHL